MLKCFCI